MLDIHAELIVPHAFWTVRELAQEMRERPPHLNRPVFHAQGVAFGQSLFLELTLFFGGQSPAVVCGVEEFFDPASEIAFGSVNESSNSLAYLNQPGVTRGIIAFTAS